jgi:hypothetical protein
VLNPVGDTAEQIANLALFSNVQSSSYWSGTQSAPDPDVVWAFRTQQGFQGLRDINDQFNMGFAVAVRRGDVTASVPEPQTLALVLLALGATVVVRRRRAL